MGKVYIGICDDQPEIVEQLSRQIRDIMGDIPCDDWDVLEYISPSQLLKDIEKINILLLDIEMPEMDGIEVGKKVMAANPDCKIIMATSRIDRFKEAFFIDAIRFVTKPFFAGEIKEAILAALEVKPGEAEVEAFRDRVCFKIKEKDISMVRAFNGYVEIMAGKNVFRKDISMNALEEQLDDRLFFRVNRQYLVNLGFITSCNKNIVVVGDKKFNISIRRRKEFVSKYTEYDLNYR